MKNLPFVIGISALALAAPGLSHPTTLFDSFGECNAALNQQNKVDRERVGWFFPNNGAAEVNMLNNWQCVYDPGLGAWHFDGQPLGGDNLGNGNGKAQPGTPRE